MNIKMFSTFLLVSSLLITNAYAETSTKPIKSSNETSVGMIYNTTSVKACGVALALGKQNIYYNVALEDAKSKAVKKAVARFVAPSDEAGSLYQNLVTNYNDFINGNIKVNKKEIVYGKFLMFCDVPVNFEKIQQSIKQQVMRLQKQNRKDKAIFLVRVTGLPDGVDTLIPSDVLMQYEEAFKLYNFKAIGSDVAGDSIRLMLNTMNGFNNKVNYMDYRKDVLNELTKVAEVSIVILGEINVSKLECYNDNCYSEVKCYTEVLRMQEDGYTKIGEFEDSYSANRQTMNESLKIATQSASVRSAKYLAEITYNYWQTKANHVS